jgi:hypothetical protein
MGEPYCGGALAAPCTGINYRAVSQASRPRLPGWILRIGVTICAALFMLAAVGAASARAYSFGPTVQPDGPETNVYTQPGNPCHPYFWPDVAARAYRDSLGKVHLAFGNSDFNGRLTGGTLDSLSVPSPCTNSYASAHNADPAKYQDNEWVHSTYSLPSTHEFYALVHHEYWGTQHPGACTTTLDTCEESALTWSTSTDEGLTLSHAFSPIERVVSYPYRYMPDYGFAGAMFAATNIEYVPSKDAFYVLGFMVGRPGPNAPPGSVPRVQFGAQKTGVCVMRSDAIDSNPPWRAWNGNSSDANEGFLVRFMDPWIETTERPEDHVCTPVAGLDDASNIFSPYSLTYNTYFNKYMLLGGGRAPRAGGTIGVYYTLSDDLVHWSELRLVMKSPTFASYAAPPPGGDNCDPTIEGLPVNYPTMIDPSDTSPNFENVDQQGDLFFTQFHDFTSPANGCQLTNSHNDLEKLPVKFSRSLRWATGETNCQAGGYDEEAMATSADPTAAFTHDATHNYTGGTSSYLSQAGSAGSYAYGTLAKDGYPATGSVCPNTDGRPGFKFQPGPGGDVWYSGAFTLPSPSASFWTGGNKELQLLRLDNGTSAGSASGVVSVRNDGRIHFYADPNLARSGDQTEMLKDAGGTFGRPILRDSCWHFVEVHQRIGGSTSTSLNEIWIDGTKEANVLANTPNYFGTGYDHLRAGIVSASGLDAPVSVNSDLVGIGYDGPLGYIGCSGIASIGAPGALTATEPGQPTLKALKALLGGNGGG